MSERDRWPDRVPYDDQPDATPENVPDDVLSSALEIATTYGKCPNCGTEQFIPTTPNMNSRWNCRKCTYEMKVVG